MDVYRMRPGKNSTRKAAIGPYAIVTKSTGTKTTVAVSGLAKAKSYFWQVRAKNTAGKTLSASTFWKFTTAP